MAFRVIVGYDGSDDGVRALEYASGHVVARHGELVIIHAVDDTVMRSAWSVVVDESSYKKAAIKMLTEACATARDLGVADEDIDAEIVMGHPSTAMIQLSNEADLVVVGRRSSASTDRLYVGSTGTAAATQAHCPVIMVSQEDEIVGVGGTIGLAVDYADPANAAIEWALAEAARVERRLRVMSIVRRPSRRFFGSSEISADMQASVVEEARRRLIEIVAPLANAHPGLEVEYDVSYGDPGEALVAASANLDLLVIGLMHTWTTRAVGGVARAVMTHARCPVALIHS